MNVLKHLFNVALMSLLGINAAVASNFSFSIPNADGEHGEVVTIPISMYNDVNVIGMQFDVVLPQGLDVTTNSRGKPLLEFVGEREDDHQISTEFTEQPSFRAVIVSLNNYPFYGNSGEFAKFELTLNGAPGKYKVLLTDILIVEEGNIEYPVADCTCTVTIKGDINKQDQEIVWNQTFDNVSIGSPILLEASATSGLPIIYKIISESEIAKIVDNSYIEFIEAGIAVLEATQEGNELYSAAAPVRKEINCDASGLSDLKCDEARYWIKGHNLIVNSSDAIDIFTSNGIYVSSTRRGIVTLDAGLYIVVVNKEAHKLSIR